MQIHFECAGSGHNTLVLLHGNFASWRWWKTILQELPSDYCAYAPELRGCGDTDRPEEGYSIQQMAVDLHRFVQELGLSPFHLVGHSLGGAVCLQYAIERPNTVRSLTLVCPAPAEGMPQLLRKTVTPFWGTRWTDLIAYHRLVNSLDLSRHLYRMSFRGIFSSRRLKGDALSVLVNDATRLPPKAIAGFIRSLATWNVQERLGDLDLPVLILAGKKDKVVQREALERMARALPRGRLVVLPEVGHVPQLELPEAFQELLFEFLRSPGGQEIATPLPHSKTKQSWLARAIKALRRVGRSGLSRCL